MSIILLGNNDDRARILRMINQICPTMPNQQPNFVEFQQRVFPVSLDVCIDRSTFPSRINPTLGFNCSYICQMIFPSFFDPPKPNYQVFIRLQDLINDPGKPAFTEVPIALEPDKFNGVGTSSGITLDNMERWEGLNVNLVFQNEDLFLILAHELVHAWYIMQGRHPISREGLIGYNVYWHDVIFLRANLVYVILGRTPIILGEQLVRAGYNPNVFSNIKLKSLLVIPTEKYAAPGQPKVKIRNTPIHSKESPSLLEPGNATSFLQSPKNFQSRIKQVVKGMSMDQVQLLLGKADGIALTDDGFVWVYFTSLGDGVRILFGEGIIVLDILSFDI